MRLMEYEKDFTMHQIRWDPWRHRRKGQKHREKLKPGPKLKFFAGEPIKTVSYALLRFLNRYAKDPLRCHFQECNKTIKEGDRIIVKNTPLRVWHIDCYKALLH